MSDSASDRPAVYGASLSAAPLDQRSTRLEELRLRGFTVVPQRLAEPELSEARARLDAVYARQEAEFGRDKLATIGECDTARCPFAYDPFFLRLVVDEEILALCSALLGEWLVLHLQNGILNRPDARHQQAAWHRDLPYQNFVSSRPLAISAFWCLDPFNELTGGTLFLPASHHSEELPSAVFVDAHAVQVQAPAGSVLVFDAMTFHRAGANRSGGSRRGINHVYTRPLIQQQLRLPALLGGAYREDPGLRRLLGYETDTAESVEEFRLRRLQRLREKGRG